MIDLLIPELERKEARRKAEVFSDPEYYRKNFSLVENRIFQKSVAVGLNERVEDWGKFVTNEAVLWENDEKPDIASRRSSSREDRNNTNRRSRFSKDNRP